MAKETDWVGYTLAFISGAALGYAIVKLLKGDNYTCPNCSFTKVPNNAYNCPRCGIGLRWQ